MASYPAAPSRRIVRRKATPLPTARILANIAEAEGILAASDLNLDADTRAFYQAGLDKARAEIARRERAAARGATS